MMLFHNAMTPDSVKCKPSGEILVLFTSSPSSKLSQWSTTHPYPSPGRSDNDLIDLLKPFNLAGFSEKICGDSPKWHPLWGVKWTFYGSSIFWSFYSTGFCMDEFVEGLNKSKYLGKDVVKVMSVSHQWRIDEENFVLWTFYITRQQETNKYKLINYEIRI